MKLKAIVFPIAIGALALLGACSGADTPSEIEQPGAIEQAPEQVEPMESPGMVPADPMSPDPSSMESPAPTGDAPPAS
jgi:uncharacterized protein involved in copper resistance